MKHKLLAEVHFHYENIPQFFENIIEKEFIKNRGEIVDIFNSQIDRVNDLFKKTGEPYAFGDYVEDINPRYVKLIKDTIQPKIDKANLKFLLCRYKIDDVGDIVGYVPFLPKSKIWFDMKIIGEQEES